MKEMRDAVAEVNKALLANANDAKAEILQQKADFDEKLKINDEKLKVKDLTIEALLTKGSSNDNSLKAVMYKRKPFQADFNLKKEEQKKLLELLKDEATRKGVQKEAIGDIATQSLDGKIDPMVAMLANYLVDDVDKVERTMVLKWLSNSSPSRMQLDHQVNMLSKSDEGTSVLDDTDGHILAAAFPLFSNSYDIEAVRLLNRRVRQLRVEVVGGGSAGVWESQSACDGFQGSGSGFDWPRPGSAVGGGTLPHVTLNDGTFATDVTMLEQHLVQMRNDIRTEQAGLTGSLSDAFAKLQQQVSELQCTPESKQEPEALLKEIKVAVRAQSRKTELRIDGIEDALERISRSRRPTSRQNRSGFRSRSGFH